MLLFSTSSFPKIIFFKSIAFKTSNPIGACIVLALVVVVDILYFRIIELTK